MSKLQDLLRAFPEYWQTGDESVPVLRLVYGGGSCWVHIEDNQLEIIPQSGNRMCIQLDQIVTDPLTHIPFMLTIDLLAAQLQTIPGLTATPISDSFLRFSDNTLRVADLDNIWRSYPNIWTNYALPSNHTTAEMNGDGIFIDEGWYLNQPKSTRPLMIPGFPTRTGQLGAVILTDTHQDISQNQMLGAPTNLLWNMLKPIARMLYLADIYGQNMLHQMDLRTAEGIWLDRWGQEYGIPRLFPETDAAFRRRISSTVFRPRLSPTSMEKALTEGLGFTSASITESGTPFKFLVNFSATPDHIHYFGQTTRQIIDNYRAAGTSFDQTAHASPAPEELSVPLESYRMRKSWSDGTVLGLASTEGSSWAVDVPVTTPVLPLDQEEIWGGSMFGGTRFG